MRRWIIGLGIGLSLFCADDARAQVAWDSPFLMPPRNGPGFGIYLMEAAGGGTGVMGTYRPAGRPFGLRFGIADANPDIAAFGGIDFSGTITRSRYEFPLDIDWVLGAGLSAGDDLLVSFPIGLTVGHTFDADGVIFVPYATPRVVLDIWSGDDRGRGDNSNLDFAFDIGLDLAFDPNWRIRFGATIGDREALAIGIVF